MIDMKCVILAGGYGSRISEETHNKPKPMIDPDWRNAYIMAHYENL